MFQYQLAIDWYARQQNWAPEFELQDFFGQILHFLIINIPPSPKHSIEAESFIYAAIHKVRISEPATDCYRINYHQHMGPMVLVDLNQVKCVVRHMTITSGQSLTEVNL